jgi:hyperosmotically inducible protein
MNTRILITSALAASLIALSGCAVTRGQESVGAYVDDAVITTNVKARFVDNKAVDAASIKVETLNGACCSTRLPERTHWGRTSYPD